MFLLIPFCHLCGIKAWDATKLAAATRDLRRERALVLAQKNPVAKVHRRKEAIKEVKRLFEAEEWEELSRALLPDIVVDKALDLAEFWWRVRVPVIIKPQLLASQFLDPLDFS